MRTKRLYVLIHIRNKGEVGTIKLAHLKWSKAVKTKYVVFYFLGHLLSI